MGVLGAGFSGTEVPPWLDSALRDGLAGVCLYADNTPTLEHARAIADRIRLVGPQACVMIDEEGGEVTGLQRNTGSSLPGNAALGWLDDVVTTREVGAALGRLVGFAGADLDLAPCVDVASNPLNRIIGTRSFGPYTDVASRHGRAIVDGLHSVGVGGCTKHFPGHGDTIVDSHWAIAQIDAPRERLMVRDMAPFGGIAQADAVMVGHIMVPAMGPEPASVSPWAYEWIRHLGFTETPIMTNALVNDVVAGEVVELGIGEACVRALAAGADLCLTVSPMQGDGENSLHHSASVIADAISSGRLDADRLAASVTRNRAMVARLRAMRAPHVDEPLDLADMDDLGLEVATRAVVVRGHPTLDPHSEALFMDLRSNPILGSVMLDALSSARAHAGHAGVRVVDFTQLATLIRAGHRPELVLQTREPLGDPDEAEALSWTLSLVPHAVVLHTGMVSAAPLSTRMIGTHGVSRPSSIAAAEVMVGWRN